SAAVIKFLKKMSDLWKPFFEPVFIPYPDDARIKIGTKNIEKMEKICEEFKTVVKKNVDSQQGAIGWSWKYLAHYLDLLDLMLPAFSSYLARSPECRENFERVIEFLRKKEKILHPVLDVSTFINVLQWRVNEAEGIS
ncbi:MAG: hypothetical protein NC907_04905, partial [Candidatus Omnitrophica bacterium]|nr:hypothetical protein [Candidatus Omnitrophota bacterium]